MPTLNDLNTASGFESFLKAYHQELSQSRDMPPLKINKALHSAAAVLGFRNGESLLAALRENEPTLPETVASQYVLSYTTYRGELDTFNELSMGDVYNDTLTWKVSINGQDIHPFIFDEELFPYTVVEREEQIEELYRWIGESPNTPVAQLMKQDLDQLKALDDEFVFSSKETNDFVAQSEDPVRFDELCHELLELNKGFMGKFQVILDTPHYDDLKVDRPDLNICLVTFGVNKIGEMVGDHGRLILDNDNSLCVMCKTLHDAKALMKKLASYTDMTAEGLRLKPTYYIFDLENSVVTNPNQ